MAWAALAFVGLLGTGAWWVRECGARRHTSTVRDVLRIMRPGSAFIVAGGAAIFLSRGMDGDTADVMETASTVIFSGLMYVGFWRYARAVRANSAP